MEIEVQGYLTLRWNETRLELTVDPDDYDFDGDGHGDEDQVHLDVRCIDRFWTPDVWIERLVHFGKHEIMGDLARLKIRAPYEIEYWQSINLRLSCPMNLDRYPLDVQECLIRFSSNGLKINMQQYYGQIVLSNEAHRSQGALEFNMTLTQDSRTTYHTSSCPTDEPCWPQIAATFRLDRQFMNYALQVFVPTGCLVVLSWISFLIPPYIVPGRMVLLVTLLLVLFGSFSTDHQDTPRSSGVKMQDIFQISCIIFVLAAIGEYAGCLYLKRSLTRKRRKLEMKMTQPDAAEKDLSNKSKLFYSRNVLGVSPKPQERSPRKTLTDLPAEDNLHHGWTSEQIRSVINHHRSQSLNRANSYGDIYDTNMEGEEMLENIDSASLKIFPSVFFLYLVIFWATFLVKEQ